MTKFEKLMLKIISGTSDNNVDFGQLRKMLVQLGFKERIKGSHHIPPPGNYPSGLSEA